MLYEQIRHAHTIRRLYKMRHVLARKRPPEMGTQLGYPRYSKQFYRVKSKLKEEGIIGNGGTFVESLPNMHVAVMPLRVDGAQIRVLGRRVPYTIFLALATGKPRTVGRLAGECHFSRKAVYDALGVMGDAGLVGIHRHTVTANERSSARLWLEGYIEAVMSWIDVREDTSVLFRMIPSYVGGPHARILRGYEPGAPMGLAEMHIFTHEPFLDLMKSIVQKGAYFRRQPRRVAVRPAEDVQITWVEGIPYQKDAGKVDC